MIFTIYSKTILIFLFLIVLLSQCKESPNDPNYLRPDLIQISIVSPIDSSVIFEPIVITVEVESINPIIQVNFFIDNKIIAADVEAPYSIAPDITPWADNENHTLKCSAEDNLNNVNSKKVTITISDQVKSNITLLEPAQNDTIRNDNKVNLKWHHDPTKKFKVQIVKDASFNDIVQSDSTNQKSFITNQLERGTYYWRIGYYSTDISDIYWSGSRQFTIDGPRAPTFISHQNEEIRKFNIANTFIWKSSEYAVQYQFQLTDYNTGEIIYDDIVNDTLITKNLEMNVYKIKARAKNGINFWSDWSPVITFSNGIYTKKIMATGDIEAVCCLELPDSGFVIGSFSYNGKFTQLMKVDELGNEKYSYIINDFILHKFSLTSDNYIIMVGRNSNFHSKVVKADHSSNTIWEYEPVNNDRINLANVSTAQNGDYLLVGDYRSDYSLSGKRVYYSGLSTSGNMKFEKVVGDSVSLGYNILEKNNNCFIMAKHIDSVYISTSIYNLIVDIGGNLLSEYRFLVWRPGHMLVDGIISNNNVYCFGYRGIANGSYLHKSDIFGAEHWIINLGNTSTIAQAIAETTDGNIIIGGYEQGTF